MMNVQQRKALLVQLGQYLSGDAPAWLTAQERAFAANHWFIPEFIRLAVNNIANHFLQPEQLQQLIDRYPICDAPPQKKVGIVMAGNIPLVGFHDFLCVFLAGHHAMIKPSSKDDVLIRHIVAQMTAWAPQAEPYITVSEMIRHCDAYIATGSNNASRYFEFYFQKYPSIIRRNRTSVAVLNGNETAAELDKLADDVYQYFGLGCRNVTQVYVPEQYNFVPMLQAFRKYDYLSNHHKYKNNYDYNLAIHLLSSRYYMSNESLLLVEDPSPFSRISQLHYQYYRDERGLLAALRVNEQVQCLVSSQDTPFGQAQVPEADDYADGVDTMAFLMTLGQVNAV